MKGSVFFEQVLPSEWSQQGIVSSKKRRALQDAIECQDLQRIIKSYKEYKPNFQHLLRQVSENKTNLVLREQPRFQWSWEKSNWMSSCWQFEHTMIHAVGFKAMVDHALTLSEQSKWQEAGKACKEAYDIAKYIESDILPKWSWKAQHGMFVAFPKYWKAKKHFASALRQLCTLQYGFSTELSRNNALKLLDRVEKESKDSIVAWTNPNNTSLLNWACVSKFILTAANHIEVEEYGKAIGLLQKWESVYEELQEDHLKRSMVSLTVEVQKVLDCKIEWESANSNIHYQVIEVP